ncbi:flippase [Candidatus Thiosymbion oneisti]|uniref:flippase n=1 Tax=Candidatus Thiosymbion oneisti TaxID=589554 RepID=UPI0013FDB5FC|nr:flippase [Candidatus Thiosymbion oneisti]
MSIRRNTTYNLLGAAIPFPVSFVTVPIYIGLIGEARYAVLAIAWLLLGYFGLFDLGLGRATAQRIAALGNAAAEERTRTFWTALIVNLGLGIIGGLLIWPAAAYFFENLFKIEDALRPEIEAAVPWLILAVPMATTSGVLTGALQGRERFLELNLISVSGTVLFQLLPLFAVVVWGPELGVLLPAVLAARLFTLLMLFQRCRRHLFRGCVVAISSEHAGHLLRFGGWVTVTAFVDPLMVIFDRFVIGAVLGAKSVTYYTVPFQLAERGTIIPSALISALFPRFAAVTRKEEEHLAQEGMCLLAVVMTPLVAAGVLLMEPFLAWWIGPVFAEQSTPVGQVIFLGFWVRNFVSIPLSQLQSRGRPDLVAKCHLVEVLPYFGLLYLGLSELGLVGVAVAFSLRAVADFVLLAGLAGTLHRSLHILAVPAFLLAVAYGIADHTTAGQPEWYLLVTGYQLITVIWVWHQAPSSLRQLTLRVFRRLAKHGRTAKLKVRP